MISSTVGNSRTLKISNRHSIPVDEKPSVCIEASVILIPTREATTCFNEQAQDRERKIKMRFFGEKKQSSPASSLDNTQYPQNYPGGNGYADDGPVADRYDNDLNVPCPPHTTERKLLARIDLHVMPFLCIMYRMWIVSMLHARSSS